jgi:hypothetical protein
MAKADKKAEAEARARASAPRTKSDRTRPGMMQAEGKRSVRERMSQRMLTVGFMRRRYVKRMLKYLDKSKEKGRRLPPEMYQLQRFLSQVPKDERAAKLEEVITSQSKGNEEALGNRDLRRASLNQTRQSGRGGNRYRPGMAPRSLQQGPKAPKKPR